MNDELHEAILAHIHATPGDSARRISVAVGANECTVRTRLARMVERDQIRREGVTVNTKYYPLKTARPTWVIPDEYAQVSSIWRVATRIAAEVRGQEWRA